MEGYEIYALTLSVHFALRPFLERLYPLFCVTILYALWGCLQQETVRWCTLQKFWNCTITQETSETAKSHIYSIEYHDQIRLTCPMVFYALCYSSSTFPTGQSSVLLEVTAVIDCLIHSLIHRSIVSLLDSSYPSLIQQTANSSNKQSGSHVPRFLDSPLHGEQSSKGSFQDRTKAAQKEQTTRRS